MNGDNYKKISFHNTNEYVYLFNSKTEPKLKRDSRRTKVS